MNMTDKEKIVALVNLVEEICKDQRELHVDDSVCDLCEYNGAYQCESGDWMNECPGFERDDCFCLKKLLNLLNVAKQKITKESRRKTYEYRT